MLNYVYFTLDSHDVLIPALIYRGTHHDESRARISMSTAEDVSLALIE